jgi:hypothetical protein
MCCAFSVLAPGLGPPTENAGSFDGYSSPIHNCKPNAYVKLLTVRHLQEKQFMLTPQEFPLILPSLSPVLPPASEDAGIFPRVTCGEELLTARISDDDEEDEDEEEDDDLDDEEDPEDEDDYEEDEDEEEDDDDGVIIEDDDEEEDEEDDDDEEEDELEDDEEPDSLRMARVG